MAGNPCAFCTPGEDSGRIVIWNIGPVVDEKMEADENVPKLLCQIDDHTGEFLSLPELLEHFSVIKNFGPTELGGWSLRPSLIRKE